MSASKLLPLYNQIQVNSQLISDSFNLKGIPIRSKGNPSRFWLEHSIYNIEFIKVKPHWCRILKNYTCVLCTTVRVTHNPQQGRSAFWKSVSILWSQNSQTPALPLTKGWCHPQIQPPPRMYLMCHRWKIIWLYIRLQCKLRTAAGYVHLCLWFSEWWALWLRIRL